MKNWMDLLSIPIFNPFITGYDDIDAGRLGLRIDRHELHRSKDLHAFYQLAENHMAIVELRGLL